MKLDIIFLFCFLILGLFAFNGLLGGSVLDAHHTIEASKHGE